MPTIDPIFGCHIASGPRDKDGYAFAGKTRAHIAAWVRMHGDVPDGMVLDHLCRRRACCAPHHLEAVDQSENERRKSWRYRARRTHCPRGHALNVNAIVTPEGGRVCRQCNRDSRSST